MSSNTTRMASKALNGWDAISNTFTKAWNSQARERSWKVAKEISSGMDLRSKSFALQAGLGAAGGGAAGYYYGDGSLGTTAKGAGLGVLGAAGYRGVRSGISSYKTGLLGAETKAAKGFAGQQYRKARSYGVRRLENVRQESLSEAEYMERQRSFRGGDGN